MLCHQFLGVQSLGVGKFRKAHRSVFSAPIARRKATRREHKFALITPRVAFRSFECAIGVFCRVVRWGEYRRAFCRD